MVNEKSTTTYKSDGKYKAPFYDGAIYSMFLDRLLAGLHREAASWVGEGSTCLDACCGTGGVTFKLAGHCRRVVGIDISDKMVAHAQKTAKLRGLEPVSFRKADITNLQDVADKEFDFATVVMGLHEMPQKLQAEALSELLRVAQRVIVTDFVSPMPISPVGLRVRLIERLAGKRHFAGYRSYQKRGGLYTIVEKCRGIVEKERLINKGTVIMASVCNKER